MYIYYIFSTLHWYAFITIPTNIHIFANIGLEVCCLWTSNVTLLEILCQSFLRNRNNTIFYINLSKVYILKLAISIHTLIYHQVDTLFIFLMYFIIL